MICLLQVVFDPSPFLAKPTAALGLGSIKVKMSSPDVMESIRKAEETVKLLHQARLLPCICVTLSVLNNISCVHLTCVQASSVREKDVVDVAKARGGVEAAAVAVASPDVHRKTDAAPGRAKLVPSPLSNAGICTALMLICVFL